MLNDCVMQILSLSLSFPLSPGPTLYHCPSPLCCAWYTLHTLADASLGVRPKMLGSTVGKEFVVSLWNVNPTAHVNIWTPSGKGLLHLSDSLVVLMMAGLCGVKDHRRPGFTRSCGESLWCGLWVSGPDIQYDGNCLEDSSSGMVPGVLCGGKWGDLETFGLGI